MLQQEEDQRYGWGGNGNHGSHRLKALTSEESGFVQEVDEGNVFRSGGGVAGGYRAELAGNLTLNTASCSGYGADLTLFSPSDLFSPSSRQLVSSPFNWQSLLCGQPNNNVRWHPDTPAFSAQFGSDAEHVTTVLNDYGRRATADNHVKRRSGDNLSLAHESSASDGVISEVEGEVNKEWRSNVNPEKETWIKFGGRILAFKMKRFLISVILH